MIRSVVLAAALVAPAMAQAQQFPDYYPADYGKIVEAAKAEGKLVIYAPLDASAVRPLVEDFQALYPGIIVEANDLSTTVLQNRFLSEVAAGADTADFVWSSAMDLQVQLVNDGHALAYESPEIPKIPKWAVWKNEAYGTTFEPIVFIYNKAELAAEDAPQTHADVAPFLIEHADLLEGRVVNYDIEKSGIGFLTVAQDSIAFDKFWDIPEAFGKIQAQFISGSGQMIESIGSGENAFAYNQLGAYARRVADNPDVGVIMPKDYTLIMSRVAFIAKNGKHPNAGKLWLDYILSQRGQQIVVDGAQLYSLRDDIEGEFTAGSLTKTLGSAVRPMPISAELLEFLDAGKRTEFLSHWQQLVRGG
ncbi:MAG: ABC transporter substrate-binding protein [Geminicoccaceae bacterium]